MKKKTFAKILSSVLAVVMVLCMAPLSGFVGIDLPDLFSLEAAAYTEGNFYYYTSYYTDEYGVKQYYAYVDGCINPTGDIVIPETLGGYPVRSISSYAFEDCTSLTSVTIPDSVISIGNNAFDNCTSLTNVYYTGDVASWCAISFDSIDANPMYYAKNLYINDTLIKDELIIPDSVTSIGSYAFYDCDSLTSVTIPDSVESIGSCAFRYCTSLTSVTIGDSVESIGSSAFRYCTNLARVYYTGDIASWCGISFGDESANPMCYAKNFYINNTLVKEIVIPDTVTEVKAYAFYSFEGVTSVTIGDSVESIGYYAFYNCTSLTDVYYTGDVASWCAISFDSVDANPMYYAKNLYINDTLIKDELIIPDSVESIGSYAFYNSDSLTSVTIGDSVESIGSYAFNDCYSLISVTIGDSVTSIGSYAFGWCSSLTNVYYNGDIASWCEIAFESAYANPMCYGENFYIDGELVENLVIPEGTSVIKSLVFYGFNCLKSVTIPTSVITIREDAFYGCGNIETVYYNGSDAQWEEIAIYNGNDCLKYAKKTFLDGTHQHIYNSKITTAPTCTKEGSKTLTCTCGETYTEAVPALGHTWGKWIVTVEPTSTTDGRKVRSCTACNDAVEEEVIPKTGYGGLQSVSINNITLVEGTSGNLNPTVSCYGDISYTVSYSSSDKSVAIVDAEGTVAALKAGTATITCKVTANNGKVVSDTCTVTVQKKTVDDSETSISVKINNLTLVEGETGEIVPVITNYDNVDYTISFTSSNKAVAVIDADGTVGALNAGKTTITCTLIPEIGTAVSDNCTVTVTKKPADTPDTPDVPDTPDTPDTPDVPETKLSVNVNDFSLDYKATTKLNPEIVSSLKYTVEYSSSDESVATVDKNGNVTATGEGTAVISVVVTDAQGKTVTDTCKVTVAKTFLQWLITIFLLGFLWY